MSAASVSDEWRFQAQRDLEVAKQLGALGFYDWCAYASQQAAEKAIKAVRHALAIDLHDKEKKEFTHNLIQLAKPLRELSPSALPDDGALAGLMFHEADGRYPGVRTGPPVTPAPPVTATRPPVPPGPYQAPGRVYTLATAYSAYLVAARIVIGCGVLVRDLQAFWNARP